MTRYTRVLVLLLVVVLALTPTLPVLAQDGEITLLPFEDATFGIQGLVPEGWTAAGPGVQARAASATDVTTLIQQAAPGMSAEQLGGILAGQLGTPLPEPTGTLDTAAFGWTLYTVDVTVPAADLSLTVDVALAEADGTAYVILLQMAPDEHETLHEAVFLPVVEALAPLSATEDEATFTDPEGRYSAPIPTNWTAAMADGYALFADPDGDITVRIAVVEATDVDEALAAAWAIIDPEFTPAEGEVDYQDIPITDLDTFVLITYPFDEGDFTQVEVRVYEGLSYVLIWEGSLEAAQRRAAQVQIIDTGFTITAMEEVDLSLVEPLPLSDELIAAWEAYIVDAMARFGTPGAAVAIVQDGEIVYSNGFGVRELGSEEPVTPETLFMIGSTTKTLTTLMMAMLVDEGAFAWDTPVVDVLPGFAVSNPAITQAITMENLVCACTGVPRRDAELTFNAEDLTAEGVIESLATFEFFTDFGEAFQYSNQMVAAGGYIAAIAAGAEYGHLYDDYLALFQARVLDPLGMTASTFDFDTVTASGNYAMPHSRNLVYEQGVLPLAVEQLFLAPLAPAGALWSNAEDMARYMIMLMNDGVTADGTHVVSSENLHHLWEPQVPINAEASYGLGWIVGSSKGLYTLSHGGNTLGETSEFAFLPDVGIGVIVLSNEQGSLLNGPVAARLFELLYEQEPEADAQAEFALDLILEQYGEVE
ncbi:MAG: beta-lactamase family protein, partial [Anaerolineae bacterium]|nr:beta-lactamase family protein [Anaerolineae bacterium]